MNQLIRLIFSIILLISNPFTVFAEVISHEANLVGKLVYSSGASSLILINLSEPEHSRKKIYKSRDEVASILHLTKVDETTFLFDECSLGYCVINKYDFKSNKVIKVRNGIFPTYIASTKELLFYNNIKDGKQWLYKQKLDLSNKPERITKAPPLKAIPSNGIKTSAIAQPFKLSSDELVIVGEDTQLWRYRISDSSLHSTKVKDCIPGRWQSTQEKILCLDWNTGKYFLLSLKDNVRKGLDKSLNNASSFLYVPETNSLIYSRVRVTKRILSKQLIEASNIFYRNFNDKNEVLVLADTHGIRSGLWFK